MEVNFLTIVAFIVLLFTYFVCFSFHKDIQKLKAEKKALIDLLKLKNKQMLASKSIGLFQSPSMFSKSSPQYIDFEKYRKILSEIVENKILDADLLEENSEDL